MKKNYKQVLNQIKAFAFDMDGVLNSGVFQIGADGKPVRNLNSKDGYAVQLAVKKGYPIAIISGGHCDGVKSIMRSLGVTDIYMRASHKVESWEDYLAVYSHLDIKAENVLYMGDDVPDIPVLKLAGLSCAPSNAVPEVRQVVDYVSPVIGGQGCVRDVIEQTLKVQDNWMLEDDYQW